MLHTFQIGFDFPVVLRRREAFWELLANFDPDQLARFDKDDLAELPHNPRNRRKLEASVQTARAWPGHQSACGEWYLVPRLPPAAASR